MEPRQKKHLESDIAPPLPRYVDVAEASSNGEKTQNKQLGLGIGTDDIYIYFLYIIFMYIYIYELHLL